ncbi:DUF5626 family protein [Bacillus solitudinis]|uniref:DUF5626 family protein n=1 Tax=Bacillus solitudinis TaxID=2014074 RepID=UPI000C24FD50|nr:DUF5626 family protein [Bacillus solitudinis]
MDKAKKKLKNLPIGESETIEFEDGSKIEYGTKIDEDFISISSLNPGSYRVTAYWYTGLVNADYKVDIVIKSGSNNDYIVKAQSPGIVVIGGSYSNDKLVTPRTHETSTRYAYSHLSFDYSLPGVNAKFNLYLQVGKDNHFANQRSNFIFKSLNNRKRYSKTVIIVKYSSLKGKHYYILMSAITTQTTLSVLR